MDVIVQSTSGEDSYRGEVRFAVEEGVLTAYADDGSRVLYAPTFCQRVSDAAGGKSSQ